MGGFRNHVLTIIAVSERFGPVNKKRAILRIARETEHLWDKGTVLLSHFPARMTIQPGQKNRPLVPIQSTIVARNSVGEQPFTLRKARLKDEMLEKPDSKAMSMTCSFGLGKRDSATLMRSVVRKSRKVMLV